MAKRLDGLLGLVTMSYQLVFELLGPICSILYMLWPWFRNMFPKSWLLCAGYAGLKLGCVIVAGYLEVDKDVCLLLKQIPKLVWGTIVEICLHVLITGARLYGMATFSRRRLLWWSYHFSLGNTEFDALERRHKITTQWNWVVFPVGSPFFPPYLICTISNHLHRTPPWKIKYK